MATRGFSDAELKPTHLALKIYPRSEDEQWKMESMKVVSNAPLDNLRVREQIGSNIYDTTTSIGVFRVYGSAGGTISLIYHDPNNQWKITSTSSYTTPYAVTLGASTTLFPAGQLFLQCSNCH